MQPLCFYLRDLGHFGVVTAECATPLSEDDGQHNIVVTKHYGFVEDMQTSAAHEITAAPSAAQHMLIAICEPRVPRLRDNCFQLPRGVGLGHRIARRTWRPCIQGKSEVGLCICIRLTLQASYRLSSVEMSDSSRMVLEKRFCMACNCLISISSTFSSRFVVVDRTFEWMLGAAAGSRGPHLLVGLVLFGGSRGVGISWPELASSVLRRPALIQTLMFFCYTVCATSCDPGFVLIMTVELNTGAVYCLDILQLSPCLALSSILGSNCF